MFNAYRQYGKWIHQCLGTGNVAVIPSAEVERIYKAFVIIEILRKCAGYANSFATRVRSIKLKLYKGSKT